ncbi:DnaD domain protein [Lactococcus lactis subsp. lactis]|uniref:DnaD domain protein n=1 Tax=Lactococcus lactis TaxID=1358 RepID=UPI00338F35DF
MVQKNKTKIYFWLKLDENFYKNIIIKKARKTSDTMVIVYQRLMLQSLATNGYLYYEGAFENLAEELATSLDEDVEQVQMALAFFSKYGLIQFDNEQNANMLQVHALIDQETNWARYQRENRKKGKAEKLDIVQPLSNHCPTEIELELEIEIEKDIEKELDLDKEKNNSISPPVNKLKNLTEFFESEFGLISPVQLEELRLWVFEDNFDIEVIKLAVKEASLNNKRTLNYVKGILRNWRSEGIETVSAVNNRVAKRFDSKQPKEWTGAEIPLDGPWNK